MKVAESEIKEHLKKQPVQCTLIKKKMGVGAKRFEYPCIRLTTPREKVEEIPLPEFNSKENLFQWINIQVRKFQGKT